MYRTVPDRLNDADRAEHERLTKSLKTPGTLTGLLLQGAAWVTAAILVIQAADDLLRHKAASTALTLVIVAGVILGAATLVGKTLTYSATRRDEKRLKELEVKSHDEPYFPPKQNPRGSSNDGTNWARYPVTGTYNPELYYERGGRSTAGGMAAWGIDDYDTYRSNIE